MGHVQIIHFMRHFLIIKYNVLMEKKITVFMMIAKYLKIQTIR